MKVKPVGHRLQFNIDVNVWMYKYRPTSAFYRPFGQRLTAADIQRYVEIIADAGVDTLTVNAHSTQFAYYPSKTVPTVLDGYRRGDRSFFYGHVIGQRMIPEQIETYLAEHTHLMDGYLDLVEDGIDWLAETARACRRRQITPWVSIRMNDLHGATQYPEASFQNCPLYKNPEMRLAPTSFTRAGFNYEKREVRDYVLAAIRDLVDNYDYEGLQLEWNRHSDCCPPEASPGTIDLITDWHAEIRRLTAHRARQIGKPYPLGIRCVGTLDQLRSIGLDLRAMAERDLIDFVIPSNIWQSSWDIPLDAWRQALGADVAVYGAIEFAPNYLHGWIPNQKKGNIGLGRADAVNYRLTPYCPPLLRGNAVAKLALGADGLEIYNFACADQVSHWPWEDEPGGAEYAALQRLGDLEFLRGQPKAYTLSSQTGYHILPPWDQVGPFPCVLRAGECRAGRIPMCQEPDRADRELVIQVVVEQQEPLPPVAVSFNGSWPRSDGQPDERLPFPVATMTHHAPGQVGLNFRFSLSSIREGWNEFTVRNGTPKDFWTDQSAAAVNIVSLEVAVREKNPAVDAPMRKPNRKGIRP